jgi:excinuclease ABC subunit A
MDVVRNSDWIIDLGPEGGDAGGEVLYSGPAKDILSCKKSYTAEALKK